MKHLNLNLDKRLTSNSNTTVSSQQALKSYIDSKIIYLDFMQTTEPTSFNTGDKWFNTDSNKLFTAQEGVVWDSGITPDIGQIFIFNDLIYSFTGTGLDNISTESIVNQNDNTKIKEWIGTQDEYNAITTKDPNTKYIIIDELSTMSSLLATEEEFTNSVQDKAATPFQVNQKIANYLPLAGGNLDQGAILRFTNTDGGVTNIQYGTDQNLSFDKNISVQGQITTNSLISTTGNVYKGNASGAKVIWSDSYATDTTPGVVKVGAGLSIAEDGTITAEGTAPTNMVTTDTTQTISGSKTFTGSANMFNTVKLAVVQDSWSKEVARFLNGELQLGHTDDDLVIKSSGTNTINGNVIIDSANISQYIPVQGQSIYQNKTSLTDGTINLTDDCSIYLSSPSGNITYTFNTSGLTLLSSKIVTFELLITLPSTSITCTFPTIKWLDGNEPSLVAGALNLLAFRTVDGGTTWIGNLQGVIQ